MNTEETAKINNMKMPQEESLMISSSPHIHDGRNIQWIMAMVLIALMPATFAGMYIFGEKAIRVLLLCVGFSVGFELLWCKLAGKPLSTVKDCSAALTGLLLGMNLSAGVPWWLCLIGAFLAICLGKQVFGGLGYNAFNPALVARVGLLIALPKYMTTWVPTRFMLRLDNMQYANNFFAEAAKKAVLYDQNIDAVTCATPLGIASEMGKNPAAVEAISNNAAYWNYFIGDVPGCIGETSVLALLIGAVVLIAFKLIKWQIPVAYIGTVALISFLVNYFSPGTTPPVLFHLLTGGLVLGAVFMATDMVTSPMTNLGSLIFGIGCGVITCLIRIWGNYPEGVSFAILFMNALVPLIDRICVRKPFGFEKLTATSEA